MTAIEETSALESNVDALVSGYVPSMILFASIELGLFDHLDAPRSIEDLSTRAGCTRDGMARLCRALVCMGLLRYEGDRIAPVEGARRLLASSSESSLAPIARHHQRQVAPVLNRLASAVRTGLPQHEAWPFASRPTASHPYGELERHADEYATFLEAMDRSSRGVGEAIAAFVSLEGRLVDLGCGGGEVARGLLRASPRVTVESFDLAPACLFARRKSAALGFGGRHVVDVGDILRGVPARDADAVLLSAILADFPPSERALILKNARACLKPGGLLLVSETLLDDDERGPAEAAILSVVLLTAMRGDQLSFPTLRREIEAAGFAEIVVHRGAPRDLVVARLID
ncbi:MAG: methyltransferase domain-containing protein [Polyangiaceae bacterium]|nr:methyltransferase domain-containing protein [Polyangiaceae bacterium]